MPFADYPVLVVFVVAAITALATGLGALPLMFARHVPKLGVGLANAAAAGLMLAAAHALIAEGITLDPQKLLAGVLVGLAGILAGKWLVEGREHVHIADLEGFDARKAVLIVGVMTAHSFAEGIGVGVSFGDSIELASFISIAIAVHNIPEGLAIALVLVPRGTPVWKAALWSIFTSLPQPLMAVPSYLLVESFAAVLPLGLGIAAGAMIWMVFAEIVPDANRDAEPSPVGITVTLSFAAMLAFQYLVLKG